MLEKNSQRPTFEENYPTIVKQIETKRRDFQLKAVPSIDFDDVSQILLFHIYRKWDKYNPRLSTVKTWVSRVIHNQLVNFYRNNYFSCRAPCVTCPYAISDFECEYTKSGKRDTACPLYRTWVKMKKKDAHDIKMPLSIELHQNEVGLLPTKEIDWDSVTKKLDLRLKQVLKPVEYKAYTMFYVKNKAEEVVLRALGFKSKNRENDIKRFRKICKVIIEQGKIIIQKELT